MSRAFTRHPGPDSVTQHRDWLGLVETTGPFLSLPVLRTAWPSLDPVEKPTRDRLRAEHAEWLDATGPGQAAWIDYVLRELLEWGDTLHMADGQGDDGRGDDETGALDAFTVTVAEHQTTITPTFAVVEPGEDAKSSTTRLLGLVCPPQQQPTARIPGEAWSATPADRLAHLCRVHKVPLGLVTNGRWWVLVWVGKRVTTTATFDAVSWPETAERTVLRAFVSLLCRRRFFGVPEAERLDGLLAKSLDSQEEITEALGVQVRSAVELLVAAFGRIETDDRRRGGPGFGDTSAYDVYRGAVTVMMRVVFLLFAEERRLLPSDNDVYAAAYSAGRLCAELEQRAIDTSEEALEHSTAAWQRLLALCDATFHGVEHPRLTMHGHAGSLFDPAEHPWLPTTVDDRTVLHVLQSVQYVEIGSGKARERRTLSFKTLDVEQIGYVYEGLLSFEGLRAHDVTVGLIGKVGLEDEVPLSTLRDLADKAVDVAGLADLLAEKYKDSKIGSAAALAKRLAPPDDTAREEARRRLLAVTNGDYPMAESLLPFIGVIRDDLRGLPMVILPGGLYVTESRLRKNTGTHYTPRELAEEVVEGALEPLVYAPGPLQTADTAQWRPKSSAEILSLTVADIAMGSAAFLVAAARYLAGHLIDAWSREGDAQARAYQATADDRPADADDDPVVIRARRAIIEHCLYGVDINPMAVEMAKLSLWLVSMDPKLPFTFLDDRLASGDTLLGITSLDQLEHMHLDPAKGREIHEGGLLDFTAGVRELVAEVADIRRGIAEIADDDDPLLAQDEKRHLLDDSIERTTQARFLADLTVGAALANAKRGEQGMRDGSLAAANQSRLALSGSLEDKEKAETQRRAWLAVDQVPGSFARQPLHWPLVFPEVFERGGFDAIIGNPPFLGGKKVSGSVGTAYREYLINCVARGARGNADLVAYFVLRAHDLLNATGQAGLIATNTLAQGDTREVGLDQLLAGGVVIRQSVKSRPWPSKSAVLEYCAIWTSRDSLGKDAQRLADGVAVIDVDSTLDPKFRNSGHSARLRGSARIAFIGNLVNGIGFAMSDEESKELIGRDERNTHVLYRYLNGQDLNSSPDLSASRWIIDFQDWTLAKASEYPDCLDHVRKLVKPTRDRLPDSKSATRERWWQFEKLAPGLRSAIEGLERVIALTRVSKTVVPVMIPTGQVISERIVVFATDDTAMLAMLSSAAHYWWALRFSSTLKTDLNYAPTDVFETLALPELTDEMRRLGDRLDVRRREIMLARQSGLTATYNLVHSPTCHDGDIAELRNIHQEIDESVCRAYGWTDLIEQGLDHGFHDLGRETRFTIGPTVRREVLDRLLELNHERHAAEVAAGLHDKKKKPTRTAEASGDEPALF